jgi:hypothetical protein
MKPKRLNCVATKRRGAERIYQQIKDMTREEELEFWQQRSSELRREQEELRKKKGTTQER